MMRWVSFFLDSQESRIGDAAKKIVINVFFNVYNMALLYKQKDIEDHCKFVIYLDQNTKLYHNSETSDQL